MSSLPSGTSILSISSSTRFPVSQGKGFNGDRPFKDVCPEVFYSLYKVWLWISLFVPIFGRTKFLWWWLSRALICEYSRITLGDIWLLFFCVSIFVLFAFWNNSNWFYLRFLGYLVLGFGHQSSVQYVFHHVEWVLSQKSIGWLLTLTLCHHCISCRLDTTVKGFVAGLFMFLLSYHTEYILILKSLEPGDEGTSLTSCSVSCVDDVFINGALMSVCGE